jgi:hypothetical protein
VIVRFRIGGKPYGYDEDKLMLSSAVLIEEHIGGTLHDWQQALLDGSAKAYQALGWFVIHGGDPDVPIGNVDVPMMALATPYLKAKMREIAKLTAVVEKAKAGAPVTESDSLPSPPDAGTAA